MNHADLLELYDRCQRIEIEHPGTRKEVLPALVRFLRPAPGTSFVSYSRLDPARMRSEVAEQVAYFRKHRLPFSWKVYDHDFPFGLKECLAEQGCKIYALEDVMTLELESAPGSLLALPASLIADAGRAEIRAITSRDQLADVVQVLSRVWDGDFQWVYERLGTHLSIPGFLNVYAAYVDGQPASAGWIYFHPGNPFANLFGGSTVPEQRGRGLYTALLAVRVQEAIRRGCGYLTIDASPMSGPIARRYGFRLLTRAQDCDLEMEGSL